jgi:hypothetical protein
MRSHAMDALLLGAGLAALAADGGAIAAAGPFGIRGPILVVHTAAKWVLLGATVWLALANARALAGTAIARAWTLFGVGIGAYLVAELGEAFYQLALGILNPFPSVLDVFYVAGYPLLIVGLLGFESGYAAVGYPMGTVRSRALIMLVLTAIGLAIMWPILAPVFSSDSPLLERALGAAYPLLDVGLLAAVAVLVRGTRQFGGGAAWQIWALVLAGLVLMIAGDVRYAYFALSGEQRVDAASEMLFVVAYLLLARGALRQRELIHD